MSVSMMRSRQHRSGAWALLMVIAAARAQHASTFFVSSSATVPPTVDDKFTVFMAVFPSGTSHSYDLAEIANELSGNRGIDVNVVVSNFDVERLLPKLEGDVRIREEGESSWRRVTTAASNALGTIFLTQYDIYADPAVPWKVADIDQMTNVTRKRTYEDVVETYKRVGEVNDARESVAGILDARQKSCAFFLSSNAVSEAYQGSHIVVQDMMDACTGLAAIRHNKKVVTYNFLSIFPTNYVMDNSGPFPQPQLPVVLGKSFTFSSKKMNIREATKNLMLQIMSWAESVNLIKDFCPLIERHNLYVASDGTCEATLLHMSKNKILNIIFSKLDVQRAHYTNNFFVGSLTPKPAKKLTSTSPSEKRLADFISSSAEHGFVYISLGTKGSVDFNRLLRISDALRLLAPIKAVWKLSMNVEDHERQQLEDGGNIFLSDWLPQQDLLGFREKGHKGILAFLTHCGRHSLEEAAWHGVPIVAMPLFADQPYNARLSVVHQFGVHVDKYAFTASSLAEAFHESILLAESAQQLSTVLRAHPRSPREQAADLIEYALRSDGADFLRPSEIDLSKFEYYAPFVLVALYYSRWPLFMVVLCVLLSRVAWRFLPRKQIKAE